MKEDYWIYHQCDFTEKDIFNKNAQYAWMVIKNEVNQDEQDDFDGEKYGCQLNLGDFIKLG